MPRSRKLLPFDCAGPDGTDWWYWFQVHAHCDYLGDCWWCVDVDPRISEPGPCNTLLYLCSICMKLAYSRDPFAEVCCTHTQVRMIGWTLNKQVKGITATTSCVVPWPGAAVRSVLACVQAPFSTAQQHHSYLAGFTACTIHVHLFLKNHEPPHGDHHDNREPKSGRSRYSCSGIIMMDVVPCPPMSCFAALI